jgi:uncharacterized protein (TIGR03437 family)
VRRRSFYLALPGVLWFTVATGTLASAGTANISLTEVAADSQGGAVVEVALASAGQALSAIQFDVSYQSQALVFSISPIGTLAIQGKSVWTSSAQPGLERILIVGLNQNALIDGVLATLSIQVTGGASPGVYPLGLTNAIASDPTGGPVPLSTGDGGVVVTGTGVTAPAISAVANAASWATGPVAPGEIVIIAGNFMADSALIGAQTSAGFVAASLGATTVLFDDVQAPLLYTMANQLSAIVPYEVSGQAQTSIQVEYQGVRSTPFTVAVAPTAPGIFTLNESGSGQGAIMNQDGSINGPGNPAAGGDVVSIYGTGEGQTTPLGTDGIIVTAADLRQPVQTVTVSIGGQNATVLYAGSAGDEVAGLLQIDARVPLGITPSTATPVTITIGGSSQPGVTMAVQ